jgi:signal transduction histidine kinase
MSVAGRAPAGEARRLLLLRWWHAAFAATVVFTAVWTIADRQTADRQAAALGLYGLLSVWYAITFRGLREARTGRVYLAGAAVAFAAAVTASPDASFLLFVLIPQCFVVLALRPAWVAVLGLSMLSSASQLAREGLNRGAVISVSLFGVMTVALSVLISGWVVRVAEQSKQRGELIDELDRTRTELARVSRDAGMAAERERLAGEIHDTLAQGFTSILMLLQATQATLEHPDTAALRTVRSQLALAESTARDGLAEARSLVAALGPVGLQSASLTEAVRRAVEDFGVRSGVRARLEVTGRPRVLTANTEVVLLRAAQEALANIHRHAAATEATVTLAFDEDAARLTVTDDGRGFDAAAARGYGLGAMRKRVEQMGGGLRIRTASGAGSTIEVVLP